MYYKVLFPLPINNNKRINNNTITKLVNKVSTYVLEFIEGVCMSVSYACTEYRYLNLPNTNNVDILNLNFYSELLFLHGVY